MATAISTARSGFAEGAPLLPFGPMAGTGRARGEYAKSAVRRDEILRAGVEVFSASGYRSGSIREIADRVGMSQAGLLHHFASKSELLQAVLIHRDDEARGRMGTGVELPEGVGLLRALVGLTEYNASTPGLVALFSVLSAEATSAEHPAHEYFLERYGYVIGIFRTALEQARDAGQLRDGVDPESGARLIIAASDGLQVQWLLDPVGTDMAAELRRFMQSLVTVEL